MMKFGLGKMGLVLALSAALAGCFESGGDDAAPAAVGATPPATPVETTPVNHAPEVSGEPAAAVEAGQAFAFTPTASDADNDFLEFAVTNKPAWAVFNAETGALAGTPDDAHVGMTEDITITVTDGRDQRAIGPFRISVRSRNRPPASANNAPTITGTPASSVDAGKPYAFQPSAADADGDALTFSISNRPSWASFNTASGALTGTPGANVAATFSNIVISVRDGKVSTSLPAFSIQVKGPSNRAPAISGSPATTVQATQSYSFTPAGTDPDGDKLIYSISNKPSWATFTTSNGRLTGTPAAGTVGNYAGIVIAVSDGKLTASLPAFAISVQAAPNRAPTISGTPPTTAKVGTAYSFTPTGSDPDGDTLGYSIQNKPDWASFDTANGRLTGTPTAAGAFANIIISVSDKKVSASLSAFTINVSDADNVAPEISGTPAATVGATNTYNFQPSATDADGDTLAWSIQNKPTWATFSTATGKLSGTPGASGTGTFADIVISVSDGKLSAALPKFSITVNGTAAGSATLTWQAPTQNTDGSALTNLDGFRIVYGTSANALNQSIDVTNPSVTSHVIDQLASGTWYFAVKAYNSLGEESDVSNVASKTLP